MICSKCGELNPAHAKFCLGCGTKFVARPALTTVGGNRRQVSVLFADMVQSTAMVTGADPEDVSTVFSDLVDTLTRAVERFNGELFQPTGDGIMAVFGGSEAQEDHARQACLAALSMHAEVALRFPASAGTSGHPLQIRVGIDTGKVWIRPVVGGLYKGFSVEGQPTHLAAKAQKSARPCTVAVTADVARLVEGFIEVRAREPMLVPGLEVEIPLFEVVRATDAQNRFQVATRRGLGRFVGRESELALLEQAATRAEQGVGQVQIVVGDAGVGKSRLLWEYKRRLQARGWLVSSAHSTARGARSAYYPIVAILRELYRLHPDDDASTMSAKLTRRTGNAAAAVDLPPLLALLDRPSGEVGWESLDAVRRLERTRAALIAALLDAAAGRSTAMFIDDLHEVDDETSDFLRRLGDRVASSRLLVLLEYRTGQNYQIAPRGEAMQLLSLDPLSDQTSVMLFRQLAGSDNSLAALEQELVQRVGGNPLFIEESIRMLSDGGLLKGSPGAYRALRPGAVMPIPASVTNVIESRIARLEPEQRRALQVAAVFGQRVHPSVLGTLLGCLDATVIRTLDGLVDTDLLVASSELAVNEYAFKHAFTRETAYESMSKAQRREAHERVISLLESTDSLEVPERIELLAQHATKAEDWNRAVEYLQHAARRAEDRSAAGEALRNIDEALRVVPHLTTTRSRIDSEVDLRLATRGPLVALGLFTRFEKEVENLEALEADCADPARMARLSVFVCGHHWIAGKPVRAVPAGRRAIAIAGARNDQAMLIPARQYLGGALHALGDHVEAQAVLSVNVAEVSETAAGSPFGMAGLPAVFCRATRGWSLEHIGDLEAAQTDASEAMRIGHASGHGFSILSGTFTAGSLHIARGEFEQAVRLLSEALALCRKERQRMWVPLIGPMLALSLASAGDRDEARSLIDATVPEPDKLALTTYAMLNVAEVYWMIGREDRTTRLVDQAMRKARRNGERTWEAHALHLLARTQAAQTQADPTAAQANERAAHDLALALGMRPLAAHCRLGMADILEGLGQRARASEERSAAQAEFAALRLPFWVACSQGSA